MTEGTVINLESVLEVACRLRESKNFPPIALNPKMVLDLYGFIEAANKKTLAVTTYNPNDPKSKESNFTYRVVDSFLPIKGDKTSQSEREQFLTPLVQIYGQEATSLYIAFNEEQSELLRRAQENSSATSVLELPASGVTGGGGARHQITPNSALANILG